MRKSFIFIIVLILSFSILFSCKEKEFSFTEFKESLVNANSYTIEATRLEDGKESYFLHIRVDGNKYAFIENFDGNRMEAKVAFNEEDETFDVYQKVEDSWQKEVIAKDSESYLGLLETLQKLKSFDDTNPLISEIEFFTENGNVFTYDVTKRINAMYESEEEFKKYFANPYHEYDWEKVQACKDSLLEKAPDCQKTIVFEGKIGKTITKTTTANFVLFTSNDDVKIEFKDTVSTEVYYDIGKTTIEI